jgi:hypothetical protein
MAGHDVFKRHATAFDFEDMKVACSRSSNSVRVIARARPVPQPY